MKKTNFDLFLEEQLRDRPFARHFKRAGEAWDVALQIAALRQKVGISQKELAQKLHTLELDFYLFFPALLSEFLNCGFFSSDDRERFQPTAA